MTEQYRPRGFSILPPVVKNLLIINGLIYLAQVVAEKSFGIDLADLLGLRYPGAMAFKPWQFVTYMFLHGSLMHLVFNMFALWMFGYALENIWGPKRFLVYYFITGIGAALVHYMVIHFQINPTVIRLDAIIADPTAPAIFDFLTKSPLEISQYSGEIYGQSQKFQEALQLNPDNKNAQGNLQCALIQKRMQDGADSSPNSGR